MATLQFQGNTVGAERIEKMLRQTHYCKVGRMITTLTGPTTPQLYFRLPYRLLQDRKENILDAASSTMMTAFDYLVAFYRNRRNDMQPFDFVDNFTGATVSVRFADYSLSAEMFRQRLLEGQDVLLVAHTAATLTTTSLDNYLRDDATDKFLQDDVTGLYFLNDTTTV